jgi:DNA replication protein DnaC
MESIDDTDPLLKHEPHKPYTFERHTGEFFTVMIDDEIGRRLQHRRDVREKEAGFEFSKLLNRLMSCDLLILDDFGLRSVSQIGADELYDIIQSRYENEVLY